MLSDFYRPGVALDFPKGGTQAIVAALVRGVTKHEGSHLHLNTHVAQLLIDEEARRCVGVATADGRRVMARKAVISNADLWSTRKLVDAAVGGGAAGSVRAALAAELQARVESVQRCDSFLHLHLGIDAAGLPSVPSEAFPAQWAVVKDWKLGVDAPRNLVRLDSARPLPLECRSHVQPHAHAHLPYISPGARLGGLAPRPEPRARGRPRHPRLHARHRAVRAVGAACSRRRLGGATAQGAVLGAPPRPIASHPRLLGLGLPWPWVAPGAPEGWPRRPASDGRPGHARCTGTSTRSPSHAKGVEPCGVVHPGGRVSSGAAQSTSARRRRRRVCCGRPSRSRSPMCASAPR